MTTPTIIRLFGTAPDSIVDGPGLRFAVFVQGCTHGCPGCHNPESQPRAGGEVRAIDDLVAHIAANKLAQGVTISGGEPFEQAAACAELARRCRALGLNVWTYSGYTYEQLAAGVPDPAARESAETGIYARVTFDDKGEIMDINEMYMLTLEQEILNEKAAEIRAEVSRLYLEAESKGDKEGMLVYDDVMSLIAERKRQIIYKENDSFTKLAEIRGSIEGLERLAKRVHRRAA